MHRSQDTLAIDCSRFIMALQSVIMTPHVRLSVSQIAMHVEARAGARRNRSRNDTDPSNTDTDMGSTEEKAFPLIKIPLQATSVMRTRPSLIDATDQHGDQIMMSLRRQNADLANQGSCKRER